jgi:L-threonylcarbamoyladenylate synthase
VPFVIDDPLVAAQALMAGGVVAIPTETVYGLGAIATDIGAVNRVYEIKGRPSDHPLIVHIASASQLDQWAADVPTWAALLAEQLWPGPMTLVLPRSPLVDDSVTGGLPTVAIRVPAHPMAQALLLLVGTGIAAPSANRFGRVSPTTSAHVLSELGDFLTPGRDYILEGGPSSVGVESTIIDCTTAAPHILRPGAVTIEQIEQITGLEVVEGGTTRAPGTLPAHYAPKAMVLLVDAPDIARAPRGSGLIAPSHVETPAGVVRLAAPKDTASYGRELYSALRAADDQGLSGVVVVPPDPAGLGLAIRDRLRRAAYGSGGAAS